MRTTDPDHALWRPKIAERLAKGPATSGELAKVCNETGNNYFYSWLRVQKIFPRAGKVVGESGQVNIQYKLAVKGRAK